MVPRSIQAVISYMYMDGIPLGLGLVVKITSNCTIVRSCVWHSHADNVSYLVDCGWIHWQQAVYGWLEQLHDIGT